jgi:hypothetical protein
MATNKGLLFGAALANGVNAFLDAREKGDLQRQRQALATVEQQMKQQQLANLQQVGELQGMKIADYDESVKHEREMERLQHQARVAREERLGQPKPEDPLTPSEEATQNILAGAGLLQQEGETNADYGKRLIDYRKRPDADPFVSQVILRLTGLSSPDFKNLPRTLQGKLGQMDLSIKGQNLARMARLKNFDDQKLYSLILDNDERLRKINEREEISGAEKIKLLETFEGHPDLAKTLAGVTTHDELDRVLGNSDIITLLLDQDADYFMVKGDDGSVVAIDKNDVNSDPVEIIEAKEGLENLSLADRFKLHDAEAKERSSWNQRRTTVTWREVQGQYNAAAQVLDLYNKTKFETDEARANYQQVVDLTLTNLLRKLVDPNSVVRNSEFNWVSDNVSVVDGMWAWVEGIRRGGIYNDKIRQGLADGITQVMNGIAEEYIGQYEFELKNIDQKNKRLRGNLGLPKDFALDFNSILGEKPELFELDAMKVGSSGSQTGNDGKRRFTGDALSPKLQPAK